MIKVRLNENKKGQMKGVNAKTHLIKSAYRRQKDDSGGYTNESKKKNSVSNVILVMFEPSDPRASNPKTESRKRKTKDEREFSEHEDESADLFKHRTKTTSRSSTQQ